MSSIIRNAAIALLLMFMTTTGYAQEPSGGPLSRLVSRIRQHHASAAPCTTAAAVPAERTARGQLRLQRRGSLWFRIDLQPSSHVGWFAARGL